jgi:hypothetical protein
MHETYSDQAPPQQEAEYKRYPSSKDSLASYAFGGDRQMSLQTSRGLFGMKPR